MKMDLYLRYEQIQLAQDPHKPIKNPELTQKAISSYGAQGNLELVLQKGILSPEKKMIETEAALLHRWSFKNLWQEYLDMPLIAHAYATLALKELGFDAIVGIETAGNAYAEIFKIMGFDVSSINYSHHKRKMERPRIINESLEKLHSKKKILLVDVDFVTGKTLTSVYNFLLQNNISVGGAYIGLSEWPGIEELDVPYIGENNTNFRSLWMKCGKTRQLKNTKKIQEIVYDPKILPNNLRMYNADPYLEIDTINGGAAAKKIAEHLVHNE